MKKKILNILIFLSILLVVFSASTKVEAEETVYKAVDVYGNIIPDSSVNDSLLLSPYDFILKDAPDKYVVAEEFAIYSKYNEFDDLVTAYPFNEDDVFEFYVNEFSKRCPSDIHNISDLNDIFKYYVEGNSYSFTQKMDFPFLYFPSEDRFNKFLIVNDYINFGETYLDLKRSSYYRFADLLLACEDLGYCYLVSSDNIPGYLYSTISDVTFKNYLDINKFYYVEDFIHLVVKKGKFISEHFSSSDVCSLALPNSIGKFSCISANKFKYTYSLIQFNIHLGYYSLSQDSVYEVIIDIDNCPFFIFDLNGNLKDIYVSVKNGYWYPAKTKHIFENINANYFIERVYYYPIVSTDITMFYVMAAYFSFSDNFGNDVPFDTIEEITLEYEVCYRIFGNWYIDFTTKKCKIKKTDKVNDPLTFVQYFIKDKYVPDPDLGNLSAIQKGNYIKEYKGNTYNYEFKVFLPNDETSYAFTENWYPSQNLQIMELKLSYQSIIYDYNNITSIPDKDVIEKPIKGCNDLDNFKKLVLILLILIIILVLLPIILKFLVFIFNGIINIFKNLKNKNKKE